jgi:glycosyltransferase involved in cell wall biosynthesis
MGSEIKPSIECNHLHCRTRMRLGIDLSSFLYGKAVGFNEYALSLVEGLASIPSDELELTLFVRAGQAPHFRGIHSSAAIREIPFNGEFARLAWHHVVPWFLQRRFDAFLFPANFAPLLVPSNSTVVVHDLNFLSNTQSFGRANLLYRHLIQRSSIRRCLGAIAISRTTALEVERYAGRLPEVIHNAVRVRPPRGVGAENLILCASSLSHHKNIPAAHGACLQLVEEDPSVSVCFIGNWRADQFPASRQHPRIRLLGFVSDQERLQLLAACRAVLAPSFYEGFGMPYIEALICRKALICSDIPIAREVVDDYPYWIQPPFGPAEVLAALRYAKGLGFAPKEYPPELERRYEPESVARSYVRYLAMHARG